MRHLGLWLAICLTSGCAVDLAEPEVSLPDAAPGSVLVEDAGAAAPDAPPPGMPDAAPTSPDAGGVTQPPLRPIALVHPDFAEGTFDTSNLVGPRDTFVEAPWGKESWGLYAPDLVAQDAARFASFDGRVYLFAKAATTRLVWAAVLQGDEGGDLTIDVVMPVLHHIFTPVPIGDVRGDVRALTLEVDVYRDTSLALADGHGIEMAAYLWLENRRTRRSERLRLVVHRDCDGPCPEVVTSGTAVELAPAPDRQWKRYRVDLTPILSRMFPDPLGIEITEAGFAVTTRLAAAAATIDNLRLLAR